MGSPGCPWINGSNSLPVYGNSQNTIIQTASCVNQCAPHLLNIAWFLLVPQPLLVLFVPECNLHVALHPVLSSSPRPWVYVTDKLLLILPIGCDIPCVGPSSWPWRGILSFSNEVNEKQLSSNVKHVCRRWLSQLKFCFISHLIAQCHRQRLDMIAGLGTVQQAITELRSQHWR